MRSGQALFPLKKEAANRKLSSYVFNELDPYVIYQRLNKVISDARIDYYDIDKKIAELTDDKMHLFNTINLLTDKEECKRRWRRIGEIEDVEMPALEIQKTQLKSQYETLKLHRHWCIRVSSVSGMFTVDSIRYDIESHSWVPCSRRFACVDGEWVNVGKQDVDITGVVNIDAGNVDEYIESLFAYLHQHKYHKRWLLDPAPSQRYFEQKPKDEQLVAELTHS